MGGKVRRLPVFRAPCKAGLGPRENADSVRAVTANIAVTAETAVTAEAIADWYSTLVR